MIDNFLNASLNLFFDSFIIGGICWIILSLIIKTINPRYTILSYNLSLIIFFGGIVVLFVISLGYDSIYERFLKPSVLIFSESLKERRNYDFKKAI